MIHPAIRDLLQELGRHPAFQELLTRVERETAPRLALTGLTPTARALYTALLWHATERPILLVVDGPKQAEALGETIETFFHLLSTGRASAQPQILPELDVLPYQHLSPHSEVSEERAVGLWRLASGRAPITVTPVGSALFKIEAGEFYRQLALTLRVGDEVPFDMVIEHLRSVGYEYREPVEMVGEYSVRGGILDVFSPEDSKPVRIEFLGDQVESMRRFDVETQRSAFKTEDCTLLPLLESPKSAAAFAALYEKLDREQVPNVEDAFPGWEFLMPLVRPRGESLLSLAEKPIVVLDEPARLRDSSDRLWQRLEQAGSSSACPPEQLYLRWEELEQALSTTTSIEVSELALDTAPGLHIGTRPAMSFHGNMRVAVAEARNAVEQGGRVVFFAASTGELERLADVLNEYSVPFQLGIEPSEGTPAYLAERSYVAGPSASTFLVKGRIRRGAVFADPLLAFFGFEDLFEGSELLARPAARINRATFSLDLADLKPGDYVVHTQHGVGQFLGLREVPVGDQNGDFMLLEYAGGNKLYVPLTRLDLVQRLRGAGDSPPPLDRLGGATWSRTKSRIKAKMRDMADELLKLYAERKLAEGFPFSPDSNWQREFEDAFEYTGTNDQLAATREIKRDMESEHPMDRLLCGDVGFGKTEVAMRSAFKALGDGRQVAVLAPTTVLCFQHYETFRRRFAPFPVRVEMLSRFVPPKERKVILGDLAAGKVDIIIGTHRILSRDVQFSDLGLLIVDEEQRFGVSHKERLKQMRKNVDVLTLSATPIPRTMHMSLVGLRDMSVIETAPKDRLAIHTVVAHFNEELIRTAVEQELGRGGQVYFVHNRVDSIWSRAAMIQQLAPSCRIGVGHGQMNESELEKVMLGFMRHEFDVFVCTTIIENGLDIPLANTIIIENAERYGLSELYQLRGRVGRSNRRAYAYLLVPADTELSDVARKRLAALREFSELGAGFKIAALDLELRGAGNLLGGEQHGHIDAVGYDMYVKLLAETVAELKGEEVPLEVHANLNLGLDIRIPPEYISEEHQRLRVYKKIADAGERTQADAILAELKDRFGPPPDAVENLLEFSLLKSLARRLGIESIERSGGALNVRFHHESRVDPARLADVVRKNAGAQFTPAGILRLPLDGDSAPARVLARIKDCLVHLSA